MADPLTEFYGNPDGPISSCRLEEGPRHDRVHVWNRGGKAGVLTVDAGDGMPVIVLLLGGVAFTVQEADDG